MLVRLALVAVVALLMAGCGDAGPDRGADADPDLPDLRGTTWVAEAVTWQDEPYELAGELRIGFDDDSILFTGGCNSMRGTFTLAGTTLRTGPMAATMMGCEPALMEQDAWVGRTLTETDLTLAAVEPDRLVITGPDVRAELVDRHVASPDRPLAGTPWELTGTWDTTAASSVPAGVRTPTLTIEDGRLSVFTGCNNGTATVEVGADVIEVGPIRLTRMACTDRGAQQTEATMLQVLTGTVEMEIVERSLRLSKGDHGLEFRGP